MIDRVALGNAIRIVTVIELSVTLGLAIAVMAIYLMANRHIARVDDRVQGMLTRNVISISLSYALLAAFAVAEIDGYYGHPLTWRTPIGIVAATLGVYALVEMLRFQNARLDQRDHRVRVTGTPKGSGDQ